MRSLYPPIDPFASGRLDVGDGHSLYWERAGTPGAKPAIFLHGGPGGGISPDHRRLFDPARYDVLLFDQRGCGRSTPHADLNANTTWHLVADIERLRAMMGVEQWLVFGGSWGSTLALAYGQAHPERCLGFVLRGIFLCTAAEIGWFIDGAQWFHPEIHAEFAEAVPAAERGDLLRAYHRRIMDPDPDVYWPAVRAWSRFEGRRVFLMPQPEEPSCDALDLGLGRLEAHYMANLGFFEDGQLLGNLARIAHLPTVIVQGRYDVICPPATAWRLHRSWPGSVLKMVPDAGHGAMEAGICRELVAATESFRRFARF